MSNTTAVRPAPLAIGPMNQTATQPNSRYSGTPTQRGADGQHILSSTPASAPLHTIQSSSQPSRSGSASAANGV